jgi:hypothetical protein
MPLLGAAILVLPLGLTLAQGPNTYNEHEVRAPVAVEKSTVWSLDFRFKAPRLITINVPGRGNRICWYLWYQVVNRTGEARTFIPDFELVTLDYPQSYHDEVLPSVQDAIKKIEDATGYQDVKNSVTIASKPIPPSEAADKAFPRAITGVAIWDGTNADANKRDPNKKDLADATRFSIFVSGLSNGWVLVDAVGQGADARPIVRRKVLQLNFKRSGDRNLLDSRDISFVAPAEWTYRIAKLRIPDAAPAKDAAKQGALLDLRLRPEWPALFKETLR